MAKSAKSTRKRAKIGDVLEFDVPGGFGYIQYIAKTPEYGGAIWVFCGVAAQQLKLEQLPDDGYATYYPVGPAVWHGLVQIVGNRSPKPMPTRWKVNHAMDVRYQENWFILDTVAGDSRRVGERLSDDDRSLPIAGVWDHVSLIERLVSNWRPETAKW